MNRCITKQQSSWALVILLPGLALISGCDGNGNSVVGAAETSATSVVQDNCENTGSLPTLDVKQGEATFYAADGSGSCSFPETPGDVMVAALNTVDYSGSAMCGACLSVTGPSGKVTVKVVDRCPGCLPGDVDLSAAAFAKIANPADGRVDITWQEVPCDIPDTMAYHFKPGTNQWWSAVQLRNHRNRIESLEVQDLDGEYQTVLRKNYNYFVSESGFGAGPLSFRVTDIYGNRIEDSSIPLDENTTVQSHAQFPDCVN